jgi:hypothetical protein
MNDQNLFGRTLCVLGLCLLASGCAAPRRPSFDAQEQWTFDFSVRAVNQAVPGVMETLGMLIVEREYDGAIGYVKARTPAGAVLQIAYETMTPQQTWVRVHATRPYGGDLSNTVIAALWEATEVAESEAQAEAMQAEEAAAIDDEAGG